MDAPPPSEPVRLTADDPLAGLAAWVAEGRVDEAAAQRARTRWLEQQSAEDATIAGVLLDLAERGRPVTVRSRGGRAAQGPIIALAADFVVVRERRLGDVIIPLDALATVRPAPGEPPVVGDRAVALAVVLAEALVELAADRPTVIAAAGGEQLRGELRRAGRDVLAVELTGGRRDIASIAVAALDHLVVLRR